MHNGLFEDSIRFVCRFEGDFGEMLPPEESIAQNIMLLIVSHPGEIFGKYEYGSIIWELEFNQLVKVRDWEETVRNSLVQSIKAYERRLKDVRVDVIFLR